MLRPYQEDQLNAVLQSYMEGTTQQLLMAATGTGKTVLFSNLPSKMQHLLPGKTLVTVHREELVDQAIASMRFWNPTLKIGKEMAEHYADLDSDVIVSCVASIGRTGATRMERFGWDNIDKVIIDECHHGIASTYMNVLEASGVLKVGTKKLLLGVTATPKRKNLKKSKQVETLDDADLLSLKSIFKKIIHKYTIRQAIKDGWLVPIRGFRLKTETDLSEVKTTAGDYQQDALAEAVNTSTRNQQIVKCWKDVAENRQTIVFGVDIQHTKDLAGEFLRAGVKAEAVWGIDSERTTKLNRFKSGETTVLCNAQLLTEGFDCWQVMCVLDAAPTKSSSRYTQKIGRGTRLEEGTGNLLEALKAGVYLRKKDCLVVDVCDNNKRCSLVTLPSLVGLSPDFNLRGESVTKAIDKVEELEEKYPSVDFSNLTDLSHVKAYVESLDLLSDAFTPEVKEYSKLMWMEQADGSYMISIPEEKEVSDHREYWRYRHEKLVLAQDQLEQWELSITSVDPEKKLGTFSTLKEAFETADNVLLRCRANRLKLMQRESPWHSNPCSDAQKKILRRSVGKKLFADDPSTFSRFNFAYCLCPVGARCSGVAGQPCVTCGKPQLTSGQASTAITKIKAKGTK